MSYSDVLNTICYDANGDTWSNVAPVVTQEMLDNAARSCRSLSDKEMIALLGREYASFLRDDKLEYIMCVFKGYMRQDYFFFSSTGSKTVKKFKYLSNVQYTLKKLEKCKVLARIKEIEPIPHKIASYYYVNHHNYEVLWRLMQNARAENEKKLKKKIAIKTGTIAENEKKNSNQNLEVIRMGKLYHERARFKKWTTAWGDYTEEEILEVLKKNYTTFIFYDSLVNELNKNITEIDEKIRFFPNIQYDNMGRLQRIGIRATNNICHLTSFEKQVEFKRKKGEVYKRDDRLYREDYLKNRFGEYEEFDVKASVPRVAHAMLTIHGTPVSSTGMGDLKEDIYKTMFEEFTEDVQKYFDSSVTSWKDARPFFKGMFMRLYFGGTPGQIVTNLLHDERASQKNKKLQDYTFRHFTEMFGKEKLSSLIEKWQKKVFSYCGDNNGKTEVFYHESCIYLEFRKLLWENGIDVVQVYDGFYFKKGTMPPVEEIEQMIHQAERTYKKRHRAVALWSKKKYMDEHPDELKAALEMVLKDRFDNEPMVDTVGGKNDDDLIKEREEREKKKAERTKIKCL